MDLVLLFPGQGSQKPGMGKDLAERYPAAREVYAAADRALETSIAQLSFEGPEEELTSTQNAQPALLAHGAAAWAVIRDRVHTHVRAAAGHSLGEFTAHHAAGTFDLATALRLVRRRGTLMYESGARRPGAMAAILGLSEEKVEDACARATRESGTVVPANYNTPEQLVISGEVAGVERAMAIAKEFGAKRALRLNVSGAFHSPLLEDASAGLREALASAAAGAPDFPVYSNVSTEPVDGPDDAKRLLLQQLTSPVRWTALVQHLASRHPDALFVELGPGTVLTNLVKRIAPGIATAPGGTAADLDNLMERVS